MRVIKHRQIEPRIYRVLTTLGPRYIRAEEFVPGLLVHPDVLDEELCLSEEGYCWTITHKDSGLAIVQSILEKHYAKRACYKLNKLANADCEHHWLRLQVEWIRLASVMRLRLPLAESWPEELG